MSSCQFRSSLSLYDVDLHYHVGLVKQAGIEQPSSVHWHSDVTKGPLATVEHLLLGLRCQKEVFFDVPPRDSMVDQMLEAWHTNCRINLFLIDRISDEGLRCTLSSRGGRDVARQFAHMHDVRVWALQTRAKDQPLDSSSLLRRNRQSVAY